MTMATVTTKNGVRPGRARRTRRTTAPEVRELTREQGRALLNRQARRYLDISGEEFLRRLDAGEYRGTGDPDVMHLAMLAPFGR